MGVDRRGGSVGWLQALSRLDTSRVGWCSGVDRTYAGRECWLYHCLQGGIVRMLIGSASLNQQMSGRAFLLVKTTAHLESIRSDAIVETTGCVHWYWHANLR